MPVLWFPFLDKVHAGKDLDPGPDVPGHFVRERSDITQQAIDACADLDAARYRVEVDVGCSPSGRVLEKI